MLLPGLGRVLRPAESRVPDSGERALQIVDASLLPQTPSLEKSSLEASGGSLEVSVEEDLPT
jgi:hypothetical protein